MRRTNKGQQQSDETASESSTGTAAKQRQRWWSRVRIGVLVLVACEWLYLEVLEPGLEPCAWLDIAIARSGCFRLLDTHEVLEGYGYNVDLAFSGNGTHMASSSFLYGGLKGGTQIRSSVELWQVSDADFVPLLEWTTDPIEAMALWHVADGKPLRAVEMEAEAVACSPDGILAVKMKDGTFGLWRVPE